MSDFNFDKLDKQLDDIEDLPGFSVPPQGTYELLVSAEAKTLDGKNGKPDRDVVVLNYEVMGTIKLADDTAAAPIVGDKFGEMFILDNEYGLGNLKKAMIPYSEAFGTSNLRELIQEKIQNVQITGTVKHRFNKKEDPQQLNPYANVTNVVVS